LHNPAYDDAGSKDYENLIKAKLAEGKILAWDIEIGRLEEYKNKPDVISSQIAECNATIEILQKSKAEYKQMLDDESEKYIAKRSKENIDIPLEKNYTGNPLFFLRNQNNSCWIDSIIYFLFAIDEFSYYFNEMYRNNFEIIGNYIRKGDSKNLVGILSWNQDFLGTLLYNYQPNGYNDVAEVATKIFDTVSTITLDERTTGNPNAWYDNSQYLLSNGNSNNLDQNNFFSTLFPNYLFTDFPNNLILQNPTNHLSRYNEIVTGNLEYLRNVLIDDIVVPNKLLNTTSRATYKLVSFIVNTGDGTHFICYFLKETQWWKYNDSKDDFKFEKQINLTNIQTEIKSKNVSKIVLYNYSYEGEEPINVQT
jgi:hypothetical protein